MGNLEDFARAASAVIAQYGTTHRDERRFRTKPHGARRAHNRQVTRAAKAAKRLNRADKRGRRLAPRGGKA